ncbi:MAG: hypothetical protein WBX01_15950 [Nitrososphaeraceae archaeon]
MNYVQHKIFPPIYNIVSLDNNILKDNLLPNESNELHKNFLVDWKSWMDHE